jgi:hypothetical protein
MTGAYLSYLPLSFMRSIAGFPKEGKGYFLPRAQEVPEESLSSKVWPEADVWLQRMESYHPDKADNEVVRLDLAGSGFLRLIRELRVILLQDSVVLRKRFPDHPLWKDSLFSCGEYLRFATRVESSLVNVVTPDELIMQKYWPAQEAVAKLRHEATFLELRALQTRVGTVLERLDQMERSSASLAPAPIWNQQGTTSICIGPTDRPGPVSAPVFALHPQPPPQPSVSSPEAGGIQSMQMLQESSSSSRIEPSQAVVQPPPPLLLDSQAPPMEYRMLRGSDSVLRLWTEWTLGLSGGPSIEALDRCWGARWRPGGEAMFHSRRRKVIKDIRRRVEDGTARDERQAIDQLEELRGKRSLDWLCKTL